MNNEAPQLPVTPDGTPPVSGGAGLAQPQPAGCLSALGWLGMGWVLPCCSLNFYALAARRRAGSAILFFFVFGLTLSVLQTFGLIRGLLTVGAEINRAFESGAIPEITISNGEAEVSGPQPAVLFDENGTWVVLDTTGQYTEIDRRRYRQGLLLTRTTLIVLNDDGRYQEILLSELQTMLDTDPLVINAETVTAYWTGLSLLFLALAFIFLIVWHTLVRLAYIALIALVLWGITALIRSGTGFGPVLVTGLYALAPTLFIQFLLAQVDFSFPGVTTLFLVLFWAVGLVAAFWPQQANPAPTVETYFGSERPLRGWRALIALPLLLDITLELIFGWQAWYVTFPLTFLTLAALLAVGLWPLVKIMNKPIQP